MGFFRQEYWSGLPFPSPGDLPDPGIVPHPHVHADTIKRGSKCRHSDLRTEAQERPCPGGVATPALGLCGSSGVLSVPGRMHTLKDWTHQEQGEDSTEQTVDGAPEEGRPGDRP